MIPKNIQKTNCAQVLWFFGGENLLLFFIMVYAGWDPCITFSERAHHENKYLKYIKQINIENKYAMDDGNP